MTTPNPHPEQGTPPEWAVKAAQELFPYGTSAHKSRDWERYAAIIAKHCQAPARSQSGEGVELTQLRMDVQTLAEERDGLKFYIATTIQPEEHAKVIADLRARIASLEAEAKDLRRMLDRTAEEAFGLDDTISLEPYDEYFIRQVAKLRAAARPADSVGHLLRRINEDMPWESLSTKAKELLHEIITALSAQAPRPAEGERTGKGVGK